MTKRKDSPQKATMREMMCDYLKNNDISIKDGADVNSMLIYFHTSRSCHIQTYYHSF